MLAACDRLGEKLDNLAALFQALAQSWPPGQGPAGAGPGAGTAAAGPVSPWPGPLPAPGPGETSRENQPGPGHEAGFSQQYNPADAPGRGGSAGAPGAAPDASRLLDTFARAQAGWPQQAADLRQALEAVMEFLENQAAAVPARLDLSDILARLQNLEEQQRNLQSQFSVSR
jgi:hypothetical protein